MNATLPWRDPVVAEIHAVRAELARQYADDLVAYSNAAVAHCQQLDFQIGTGIIDAVSARSTSDTAVSDAATSVKASPEA